MTTGQESLAVLRDRVAALHAPACGMAHESIRFDAHGRPVKDASSDSGYRRPGLCPDARRAQHLGCSHTMARVVLQGVLERLPGDHRDKIAELRKIDAAIGLLDHRRYAAECCRAAAVERSQADAAVAADRDIAQAVAEHGVLSAKVMALRDEVLRRLDDAIGS